MIDLIPIGSIVELKDNKKTAFSGGCKKLGAKESNLYIQIQSLLSCH